MKVSMLSGTTTSISVIMKIERLLTWKERQSRYWGYMRWTAVFKSPLLAHDEEGQAEAIAGWPVLEGEVLCNAQGSTRS